MIQDDGKQSKWGCRDCMLYLLLQASHRITCLISIMSRSSLESAATPNWGVQVRFISPERRNSERRSLGSVKSLHWWPKASTVGRLNSSIPKRTTETRHV